MFPVNCCPNGKELTVGEYYCCKKLPFLKGHRERGMDGTLVVTPDSH